MTQGYPAGRMRIGAHVPRRLAALQRFSATELDPTIAHLVEMRASQLNGCAFCLDMHWKDARAAGERAAPALTEAVTLLERGGVPDAVWDEAAA